MTEVFFLAEPTYRTEDFIIGKIDEDTFDEDDDLALVYDVYYLEKGKLKHKEQMELIPKDVELCDTMEEVMQLAIPMIFEG